MLRTLAVSSLLLLGACGQRGDLYLPDEEKEAVPAVAAPAAAGTGAAATDESDESTARRKPGN